MTQFENGPRNTILEMHFVNVAFFWLHVVMLYLYFRFHEARGRRAWDRYPAMLEAAKKKRKVKLE